MSIAIASAEHCVYLVAHDSPISDLKKLPLYERLQLVEDLWEGIVLEDEDPEIPQWQKDELDRRAVKFRDNPDSGIPWEAAKDFIRGQHV